MIDRSTVAQALAKAISYKNCGKDAEAADWAVQLARALDHSAAALFPQARAHRDVQADRVRVAAALVGPLRRNMAVDQRDAGHLPLFIAANEPGLL